MPESCVTLTQLQVYQGHLLRFIRANQYTNWVGVSLPHRFDLPPRCYTNKLVNQVNHRLKSLTKERINVIDSRRLERKHFTRHGLHLDATGKEVLCGLIAQGVSSPFPQCKDQLEANNKRRDSRHWEFACEIGSHGHHAFS
ncbi:hypothetical protein J6590_025752 [Homalodisca vitripennis]|nr:hypothetical protein J6590_025752 [Homalodisca vitripennis]